MQKTELVEWLKWQSTYLVSVRPWVQTQVPKKKKKTERERLSFIVGGVRNGMATLEHSLVVSYTTKQTLNKNPSNHASWYLPKWVENLCPHKSLHTDVYSSFIHNCQNLEATKMSFRRWINKNPNNGILFSAKKKWTRKPWKAKGKM
jgi:hypothetical protein